MKVGDLITWKGRTYVLRGVDPMSLPEREAELEDPVTGERIRVPVSVLEAEQAG